MSCVWPAHRRGEEAGRGLTWWARGRKTHFRPTITRAGPNQLLPPSDLVPNFHSFTDDGTDYMPRLVKKLSEDPGVLVLAAEAVGSPEGETADSSGGGAGRIDGIS